MIVVIKERKEKGLNQINLKLPKKKTERENLVLVLIKRKERKRIRGPVEKRRDIEAANPSYHKLTTTTADYGEPSTTTVAY